MQEVRFKFSNQKKINHLTIALHDQRIDKNGKQNKKATIWLLTYSIVKLCSLENSGGR